MRKLFEYHRNAYYKSIAALNIVVEPYTKLGIYFKNVINSSQTLLK